MEPSVNGGDAMSVSWVAMPRWRRPAHLAEPPSDTPRGRMVTHELDSELLVQRISVHVYVPAAYDGSGDRRYPVAYYHEVAGPLERGSLQTSLDNLAGREAQPFLAVLVQAPARRLLPRYTEMWAEELIPFIDATFRTLATREGRASIGNGFVGFTALSLAFSRRDQA